MHNVSIKIASSDGPLPPGSEQLEKFVTILLNGAGERGVEIGQVAFALQRATIETFGPNVTVSFKGDAAG